MIDDASSSRTRWRERAIAATRQRLRRLEIETHRIKAELARLESANEDEIADELTHALRQDGGEFAPVTTDVTTPRRGGVVRVDRSPQRRAAGKAMVAPRINLERRDSNGATKSSRRAPARRRKPSPAWMVSLGLHAAILAVLAPMTYVILTNDQTPLFATMFDAEVASDDEPGAVPIELVSFEEIEMPDVALEEQAELAESVTDEFAPIAGEMEEQGASPWGQLDALPTDVGTLMAGGGSGTRNAIGGRQSAAGDDARLGMTSFFGTPAKANRIVFLVDNSGSMKQGRMETTLFELVRSVEAMSEKQEFYVVFYSDQAYPMFYPQSVMEPVAATPENKRKLYQWLQTVELCHGGAILKAMEIAKSLKPHVVYILSDGDITGTVTMQRLTQTNDLAFAVHTLGMGVAKPQDAQNLLAIAQANRGTFQMVRPLPAAVQSAKVRPIRSNSSGESWGEHLLQAAP